MNKRKMGIIALLIILIIGIFMFMTHISNENIEMRNDTATSDNHDDIWNTVNSVITREHDGTLISRGEDKEWFYLFLNPNGGGSNFIYKPPFVVEFDIINETYRSQIEFRDEVNNTVSNFEFNSLPNRGLGHWKVILNPTHQKYYHDNDLVKTDNQVFTENIRVGFIGIYDNDHNESSVKFANFKMY